MRLSLLDVQSYPSLTTFENGFSGLIIAGGKSENLKLFWFKMGREEVQSLQNLQVIQIIRYSKTFVYVLITQLIYRYRLSVDILDFNSKYVGSWTGTTFSLIDDFLFFLFAEINFPFHLQVFFCNIFLELICCYKRRKKWETIFAPGLTNAILMEKLW